MSSDEITRTVQVELLPPTELPGLAETLAELNMELKQLPILMERARQWNIRTKQDYLDAAPDLKRIREIGKTGETLIRPFLTKVNVVRQFLLDAINTQEAAAKPAADLLAGKLAEFDRAERLAARQEQDRINAENVRKAKEAADLQRQADEQAAAERKEARVKEIRQLLKKGEIGKREAARMLKEAGANEEAEKAMAAAQADELEKNPVKVVVQANRTPVAGLRSRVGYSYTIVDIEKIPRALLYPFRGQDGQWKPADFPRLSEMVRKTKSVKAAEAEACGGIVVTEDQKV